MAWPAYYQGYQDPARRAYEFLLPLQKSDGGFPYSQREHYVLRDQRSYPRYLAMILYHLLHAVPLRGPTTVIPANETESNQQFAN